MWVDAAGKHPQARPRSFVTVPGSVEASAPSGQTLFGFESTGSPSVPCTLYPRSTYDIIHYLGALTRAGFDDPEYVDRATREAQAMGKHPVSTRIFVVEKNSISSDNFISVMYRRDRYSIPMAATATIRVMGLLRQLIARGTSVNSLPVIGTVVTARQTIGRFVAGRLRIFQAAASASSRSSITEPMRGAICSRRKK